jgi:hypothetical protein
MTDRNLIATYHGANRDDVKTWLMTHMPVKMTTHWAGLFDFNQYRWRMALGENDHRVLFDREEDFVHFSMVWS